MRKIGFGLCLGLWALASTAQAAEPSDPGKRGGFLAQVDLDFGGDDIATVYFEDDSSQDVKAGQGVALSVGGYFRPVENSSFELQGSLGYKYVTTRAQLRATKGRKVLGLFANEEMFEQHPEGRGDLYKPVVPLPEMASKALKLLSRDRDGFFVLIEEEAIDEMAHSNNAGMVIKSGAALDRTVKVAVDFARKHPGTLIVVQGDHETGGLTIENPDTGDESGPAPSGEDGPFPVKGSRLQVFADWTTGGHTGADTPITASGPGSAGFDGVIDNTDVHDVIARAMKKR